MKLPLPPQAFKWLWWVIQGILSRIPPPPVLHLTAAVVVVFAHQFLCVVYIALALAETENGRHRGANPHAAPRK